MALNPLLFINIPPPLPLVILVFLHVFDKKKSGGSLVLYLPTIHPFSIPVLGTGATNTQSIIWVYQKKKKNSFPVPRSDENRNRGQTQNGRDLSEHLITQPPSQAASPYQFKQHKVGEDEGGGGVSSDTSPSCLVPPVKNGSFSTSSPPLCPLSLFS